MNAAHACRYYVSFDHCLPQNNQISYENKHSERISLDLHNIIYSLALIDCPPLPPPLKEQPQTPSNKTDPPPSLLLPPPSSVDVNFGHIPAASMYTIFYPPAAAAFDGVAFVNEVRPTI